MKLFIPRDIFDNPNPPRFFLCTPGKKTIGQLQAYDRSLTGKWNSYAELSFSIDGTYTDVLTGETKLDPLFDKAEGLRTVLVEGLGYFTIQDPNTEFGDKDTKSISCFSTEYASMGSKYLENFKINTGEVDSKEVLYNEKVYGRDYITNQDEMYQLATGDFDPYQNYYIKEYTGESSYADEGLYVDEQLYSYELIEINNEDDYNSHFGDGANAGIPLYITTYKKVRFYNPTEPELSLLHLVFAKVPEWKIGHVDISLQRKERKFDESRVAIYDFITNNIHETFSAVAEFDTLTNTVNFYEEAEDGINEDDTIQTRWDTDIYISRQNLASQINVQYSTDDIKTKLKVSGADDISVREVNLGKNYIMNLGFYHNLDWMEQDLFDAYADYLEDVERYKPMHTKTMQQWVAAQNKHKDLMHMVPASADVVLVGDEFKKLYCIYEPINKVYMKGMTSPIAELYYDAEFTKKVDKTTLSNGEILIAYDDLSAIYTVKYVKKNNNFVTVSNTASFDALQKKLTLYHINEDFNADKSDNILLRLRNASSDVATIRIYNANKTGTDIERKKNPDYRIQVQVVKSNGGTDTHTYTIKQWVDGQLTVDTMPQLKDYTVQYIGVMGAYFVLAKDETKEATLQDYGVNLLKEKRNTYITICQAQIAAMFSHDNNKCIVQDEEPEGAYDKGTKWLDTNDTQVILKEYNGKEWVEASVQMLTENQANYENYQRYIDNYNKMVAVQKMLVKKERDAMYWQDGYELPNRKIDVSLYTRTIDDNDDGVIDEKDHLRYNGALLEEDMRRAAQEHFDGYTITKISFYPQIPLYHFTTSYKPGKTFVVYLKGTTPYVSYSMSQGSRQAKMDWISKRTDIENFVNEDQWARLSPFIREDEFSDSNFLLASYESEEQRLEIYKELMDAADKELKTLCQPSLEFSMDMANILALPEFKSLFDQFQLGNFVRVGIRDNYAKRARLLEVTIKFDDLSDLSCTFGNLVTTKSEIDKHAELLKQAVTAGKQVAASAGEWQKAVDKSSKLEAEIANGLANSTIEVGKASGQSVLWDQFGIWGRKLIDGTTDQYHPEQFRIINNKLVFSNDGFKTSKSVMGQFTIKDDKGNDISRWGLLAEAMVGGYIEGSEIRGGNLRIGDGSENYFQVSESGDVSIIQAGKEKYAGKAALDEINKAYQYSVELSYNGSTVFASTGANTIITAIVKDLGVDITHKIPVGAIFTWLRNGEVYKTTTVTSSNKPQNGVINANIETLTANQINITHTDIEGNSFFSCQVDFDETNIK